MHRVLATVQPPHLLKLLAHDIRWNILVLLARSDYCVQDIVHLVEHPHNLVSYHLRQLRGQHLVTERRSAAESRDVYYSLNFDTLHTQYFAAADALHPALSRTETTLQETGSAFPEKPIRILFLCTHNSARSQMAEGLISALAGDRFKVCSAGTEATQVRPLAIKAMAELGIDISGQHSKTLDRYLNDSFDVVITVCDEANEACPVFLGAKKRSHWSFPDPSNATGTEDEQLAVYRRVRDGLRARIEQELL